MKRFRICALLLALSMLASCLLVSCAENGDNNDTVDLGTVEEAATDDPYKTLDVPDDLNFNNYTFRVMTIDADGLYTEFDVEGFNSDPVNDAIYERNRIIENAYHVKFETTQDGYDFTLAEMQKQVKSGITGDEAYDMIMQICRNAYTLTLGGMLCDYDRLEYVDIDKEYYFDQVNRQFSIGGKTFFAYGADSLNVLAQANCLIYNKRIANEHKLPDLYELVNNHEWTYDQMIKVCTDAAMDGDGDGKYKLGDVDTMAMIGRSDYCIPNSWIPAGESLISKDEDDIPYYSAVGNDRMTVAMQEMLTFMAQPFCDCAGSITLALDFTKNRSFMMGAGVMHLEDCKDMEDDYGVIPYPMYDKTQKQYYTRLIDGWINCVPANCDDPARTSAIMQAMAYYSYRTVYDAYYELALQAKYIRDPESVGMLKLILSTLTVDLGDTVWYSSMRSSMTGTLSGSKGASMVTSVLKKQENVAKGQIRKVLKFIEESSSY